MVSLEKGLRSSLTSSRDMSWYCEGGIHLTMQLFWVKLCSTEKTWGGWGGQRGRERELTYSWRYKLEHPSRITCTWILNLYSLKKKKKETYFSLYKEPDHLQIVRSEQAVSEYIPVELFEASSWVKRLGQSLANTPVDYDGSYMRLPCYKGKKYH